MNKVFYYKEGLIGQKRKLKEKVKVLEKENAALMLQILNQNTFKKSAQKVKFHINKMVGILPKLEENDREVNFEKK